jgi:PBP1b-binding outer membrane lipoprotein LpoB
MRKFFALLALFTVAAFWSGCANDTANTSNNSNIGTTTYNTNSTTSNTSTTTAPSTTTGAPSGGGRSNNANSTNGAPTHIKPPT